MWRSFGAFLLLCVALTPAHAQGEIKIGVGFGLAFLPVYICEDSKLVEKHAKAAGLDVKADFPRFMGAAQVQEAVASGAVDMGPFGTAPLLAAWQKAKGTPGQIFAISGITSLGFMVYPTYRLALLGLVTVALLVLYFVLYRTRIGMIVRAGIEDSVMVESLGIDVYKIFTLVFGIGAVAAGFAGIVNAPVVSISPDVGESILVQAFVVVVIGGVGSFPGAVLGGLIAGEIISITSMFNPGYAYVMLFVAMTLVLVIRPYGLLGVAGRE